jgi:hypothetical protein
LNPPTSPLHSTSQPQDMRRTGRADEFRTDPAGTAPVGDPARAVPHPPMAGDPLTAGSPGAVPQGTMRKPTYEELRKLAAMYEPQRKPRRSGAAVAMVTVFLVGATAGLGGAWWMTNKNQHPTAAIAAHGASVESARRVEVPARSLSVDGDRTAGSTRGLNPAELPFDGKKQAAALPKREPAPAITPGELPYGGQTSGSGSTAGTVAAGAAELDEAVAASVPGFGDGKNRRSAGGTGVAGNANASSSGNSVVPALPAAPDSPMAAMSPSMTMPPAVKPVEKPVNEDRDIAGDMKRGKEADKEADKANGKSANTASAPSASSASPVPAVVSREAVRPKPKRQPDSRELDRIRQQAAEELRRKNEARRMPNEARLKQPGQRATKERVAASSQSSQPPKPSQSSQSRTQLVRSQLAACENAGNFLLREQCKWQLCSGNWGKNGCPSYSTSHSAAY